MTEADDIKQAMTTGQITPSKYDVKRLVNAGNWLELGRLFNFTPVMHFETSHYIDWRCVPQALKDLLYADAPVRSPQVILSNRRPVFRHTMGSVRLRTFLNQRGICFYCRTVTKYEKWTIDHKQPKSRGGSNGTANKVGACWSCNNRKGNLTEAEFRKVEAESKENHYA